MRLQSDFLGRGQARVLKLRKHASRSIHVHGRVGRIILYQVCAR